MSNTTLNLNLPLLRSVPLDKDLKRYFISKYRHLVGHNGLDYANAKFKQLESCLKTYKSTGKCPSLGIRHSGWVKKLIQYMDSQPHYVLNFLKGIYSWKGEINVDKASRDFHSKLKKVSSTQEIPSFLKEWYSMLNMSYSDIKLAYNAHKQSKVRLYYRYCKHHSLSEWMMYWRTWKKRLTLPSKLPTFEERPVFPEHYKDFNSDYQSGSESYERDVVNFVEHIVGRTDGPKPSEYHSVISEWFRSTVSDDMRTAIDARTESPDLGLLNYAKTDLMSGFYVGDIHYIPKQGTGYRPIAVPNRFLQEGLVPLYKVLETLVRRIPNDATYDQEKFDPVIQSRVTTDSRFIGSVDLSSATENLPRGWIMSFVKDKIYTLNDHDLYIKSLALFEHMCRSPWMNDGFMSKWTVGQPLGTLPSFCWLALTHHFFLEALALKLGAGHSPYRVLGDDVVIFSKKLHRAYIREMTNRNIPISVSKSYTGKLTEFAGKTYIKKNNPFLTPDHNVITWQSLFDWQFATGVLIPWRHLPKKLRNKVTRRVGKSLLSGQRCYEVAQLVTVPYRGSTCQRSFDERLVDVMVKYWVNYGGPKDPPPQPLVHTGITFLQDRVCVLNKEPREIGGLFRRYYQVQLPEWMKRKFRPTTTDSIFSSLLNAMEEVSQDNSTQ